MGFVPAAAAPTTRRQSERWSFWARTATHEVVRRAQNGGLFLVAVHNATYRVAAASLLRSARYVRQTRRTQGMAQFMRDTSDDDYAAVMRSFVGELRG